MMRSKFTKITVGLTSIVLVSVFAVVAKVLATDATSGPCTHGPETFITATPDTSVAILCRAQPIATVTLDYRAAGSGTWIPFSTQTVAAAPWTIRWELTGLSPATAYEYQVRSSSATTSTVPIKTAPTADSVVDRVEFAVFADLTQATTYPTSWAAGKNRGPDFAMMIGDQGHDDPATSSTSPMVQPANVSNWRNLYQWALGSKQPGVDFANEIERNGIQMARVWDDHDYCSNNADSTCSSKLLSLQGFTDYFEPVRPLPLDANSDPDGIYQHFSWGQVDVWMLDTRWNRTVAPRWDVWSDENSMLGEEQKEWLIDGITNSTKTWKVIISPTPWNPSNGKGDGWWSYYTEQKEIRDALTGIPGIVVVSGDMHSIGLLDDGTAGGGWPEMSVPPVNLSPGAGCTWNVTIVPTTGTNNGPCGDWSEGTPDRAYNGHAALANVSPHSGLGYIEVTHNTTTSEDALTMFVVASDGTVRRSMTLTQ